MSIQATNEEVARVAAGADEQAMRQLLARLVAEKLEIQSQLSDSKAQMTAARGNLLADGVGPREAQVRATSTTDQAWRGRAVHAVTVKDKQITRLRGALAALVGGGRAGTPQGPGARKAVAFPFADTDIFETASKLQSFIDEGWSSVSVVPHPEGVIVVFRKDFEPKPTP